MKVEKLVFSSIMFNLPDFVWYLISGAIAAFCISAGRTIGQKYIPHFPDIPLMLGGLLDWGKPEPRVTRRVLGRYLHLGSGALWGLLYGILVEQQFFFVEFTIISGILFAIIPWFFFMVVLLPLAGGGFFGAKINKYQWFAGLLLYVVFGTVLGVLTSFFTGYRF